MLKKASLGNSAAQIATAIVESNTLITYTTADPHLIFEGAKVTVTGITATTGVLPNVANALVYKVNNATSFSVKPNSDFTYTEAFPASLAVGSDATVYSINGALMSSELVFAQPEKIIRPEYFNFISPEISLVASGNGVLVTWDALGVANPQATISVERILGTSTTVISTAATSVSTSASYVLDGSLTAGTSYTYKVTALNSILNNTITSSVTTLYIDAISALTAEAKPNAANTVSLSWTAPQTNAAISEYEISRSSNGGSSWSALATTSSFVYSYEDETATANGSTAYTYRIRAKAAYAVGVGGDIYSSYTSSSAISPFFISTTTPTAATVASTANRLLVSWSAVSAAFPAVTSYELQRASSSNNSTWSEWSNVTLSSVTATSYSDTSASSAIYYKYRVRVLNPQLTSAYVESNSLRAFYLNDPLTPAPVVTRASTSNANLVISGSYAANPSITSYEIRRSSNAGSTWTTVATSAASLPYTDSTAAQNTTYIYQIKATNGELTTANWSASSTSILTYAVPNPPTSISATSINSTSIRVNWNGASTNAVGPSISNYRIDYKLSSSSTWTTLSSAISSAAISYNVTGLTTDAAYDFRVFAINAIGTSSASSTATATPVRVADTAVSLSAYVDSTPYFNTTQTFLAYAASGVNRSATLQISTDNSNWSNVAGYDPFTITGYAPLEWVADTTAARYFRLFVEQDSLYTQTISNTVVIDPVNNELNVNLYSDTYNNDSTQTTVAGTGTVTVTVTDIYGSAVSGATVYWRGVQFPGTSYTNRETTTTDSNGRSTLTLSTASLDLTTSFAFQIDAAKANYTSALSLGTYQEYTIYVRETDSATTNISRSYNGANAVRSDAGSSLYYGYFDTTHDTQKSAMGFTTFPSWAKIDASYEVISASLKLNRVTGSGENPGTLYIGTHENASGSASSWNTYGEAAFGTISARLQSHSISYSETDTVTLNRTILDTLYSGGVRGFTIGPPSSTNFLYYGRVSGHSSSSALRPVFSVTYTVIPAWNVP
jgi:hypothetical protein